jgi:2'-5' RNA ligase
VIVTMLLDERSQAYFERLRRAHFPRERLVVGAHVTLFHALPDDAGPVVAGVLAELGPAPSDVVVTGLRSLGRGVAFTLEAPGVAALRDRIAHEFAELLTPQDRQRWRPHVTVQNKVEPGAARALLSELSAAFTPFTATALGLALWRYRGGPWDLETEHRFGSGR